MPVPVRIVLNVQDRDTFKCVPHKKGGYIQFTVKACNTGLHIGLFTAHDISEETSFTNPKYVIKVAVDSGIESKVVLCKHGIAHSLKIASIPFILDNKEWRGFWVSSSKEAISFGKENESEPIISWNATDLEPIIKLGFRLEPYFSFLGNVDNRPEGADIVVDTLTNSKPFGVRWVKCSYGEIPENPFVGGHNGDNIVYVVRAYIHQALTPGTLRNGSAYSEISWGGESHCMDQYEVLANFSGDWVKCRDDKIPPLALMAGRSETNFPLYIGRTSSEGILTIGKVQPDHKVLYIPFQGEELSFKKYEILCHKPPGLPVIPHPLLETNTEEPKWVYSRNGRVPRNAFIVGYCHDEAVLLIRAKFQGMWFPGWMRSSDVNGHLGYFCNDVEEYEVLCNFRGHWETPTSDLELPDNAFVIYNGMGGETINIGRAWHASKLYCGRIINMTCEFSCDNQPIQKTVFEVLCFPNPVESTTKSGLSALKSLDA